MSGVSRRLTSKHTGPAVKRNVRHRPGQKPHRRSRSDWVTSAGLESVGHEVEEAEGDRADEGAPVHNSMIWSARTRMDCGIVRPRAVAVFRLITSSNFVTCSTGTELPPSEEIGRASLPVTAGLGSLVGRR